MAQSIFGGGTSYEEQSLDDILEDIERWLEYTKKTKQRLSESLEKSKNNGFWAKVDCDFQLTIYSSLSYFQTIINDLSLIKEAIIYERITNREVVLLKKIGEKSFEYNIEYGKTYKRNERWHDYGNPDFQVVEDMYAKGRDYFVTLQDAGNASSRLEDYMQRGQIVHNSINIKGDVKGSQFQLGTTNSSQTMSLENSFDYDKTLEVLNKIKHTSTNPLFEEEFADYLDEIKSFIEEAIEATLNHESPDKIQPILSKIKNLAKGIGTGIMANGIFKLLESLSIV